VVNDGRYASLGLRRLMMGDGDQGCAGSDPGIDLVEFLHEGTVVGGDHLRSAAAFGIGRSDHGVVVHDVEVADRLIGVHQVMQLDEGLADLLGDGAAPYPCLRYRTAGVSGGEQEHRVACGMKSSGESIDDSLGAAVGRRRHR
jgi:hypothetical protein